MKKSAFTFIINAYLLCPGPCSLHTSKGEVQLEASSFGSSLAWRLSAAEELKSGCFNLTFYSIFNLNIHRSSHHRITVKLLRNDWASQFPRKHTLFRPYQCCNTFSSWNMWFQGAVLAWIFIRRPPRGRSHPAWAEPSSTGEWNRND